MYFSISKTCNLNKSCEPPLTVKGGDPLRRFVYQFQVEHSLSAVTVSDVTGTRKYYRSTDCERRLGDQ